MNSKLKTIIAEQVGVGEDQVVPEASLQDDLGADSLDMVELVMAIEEEFDTEIRDEEAEKFQTVQDIIDYLEEKEVIG